MERKNRSIFLRMMMRYKITVEYDGTNLLGWQWQPDGNSAQGFLETALKQAFGRYLSVNIEDGALVFGAGRTDAGVHALAQVAHFDLDLGTEDWKMREALNAHLRDLEAPVSVICVEKVDESFHARFSAQGRGYIYRILNRRAPTVLLKNRVWWVPVPLDVEKMRQASGCLLGKHDFTSFRAAACQAKSPVKTLDKLEIIQEDEEIRFIVEARSFLHHQVRNFVGTLKMVGDGQLEVSDVQKILEAKDRKQAGVTAPACGLYLNFVKY